MTNYKTSKVDTKEFEIPETHFVRDIDNQVIQGIVLQSLSSITGIQLYDENFIGALLGRSQTPSIRGITVVQDMKNHSLSLKIEVKIEYGLSIPEKAEEIQAKVTEEVTRLTGLHVAEVHVVVKNIYLPGEETKSLAKQVNASKAMALSSNEEEYSDEL